MLTLNISLTSLAVILWSGMLIIAGSIWVLSSQVRKLVDLLEEQGKAGVKDLGPSGTPGTARLRSAHARTSGEASGTRRRGSTDPVPGRLRAGRGLG